MSHGIEKNEDYVYALPDGLPWHAMGVQRDRRMTIDEVIAAIPRLAETPQLLPVYYRDPSTPRDERVAKKCDNKHAIVFPSDGTYIGMATDQYKPKAYSDAFARAFGWVEALGAWVSGAALLHGGSRAFIMARVPDLDFNVGAAKDGHQMWLALFAGSDGKTGIYPMATLVRAVCNNTIQAGLAEAKADGRALSIAHHGNVDAKLADAAVTLGRLSAVRDAYQAACNTLIDKAMSAAEGVAFLEALVPGESTRAENTRTNIAHLVRHGAGNREYAGTAYAMLQGVTDHVDHAAVQTSKRDVNERRFLYAMEGTGATLKSQALEMLLAA